MCDPGPSSSSRFKLLFDAALRDYETQTGTKLADHPFSKQLQTCNSVESTTAFFRDQLSTFHDSRDDGKIMNSLKSAVHVLHALSTCSTLRDCISAPFPPARAIFAGLAILFTTIKGVSASFDALVNLLECIGKFLNRLDIYTKVPPTPAMTDVIVEIIVEVISTLALETKEVKQGRLKKFVKKLFGENKVEDALQRLDRLVQEESRATGAQALAVVYGIDQKINVLMDDGRTRALANIALEPSITQRNASMNKPKAKREKLQQDLKNWLSPPDPWKNHNTAHKSRHSGTATWFLEGNTYSEWKSSSPSSLLWIHGKPGAGKTVLCSAIIEDIDEMRKSGRASLALFYCDFREDKKKDRRELLSSLLVQLCNQSDSYYHILSDLYLAHCRGSQHPGDDALIQCFIRVLQASREAPVFVVVDALDELPNTTAMPSPREEVLSLVTEIVNLKIPNLHICVTSRPEADIKFVLDRLAFRSISLHGERGQILDIVEYVKSVVNSDPTMQRWKAVDKKMVIDVLNKKADGMFRWVYCQLVYLRRCIPAGIRRALDGLPETLDGTYERILQDIDEQNWEYAHRLFEYVAVALRPLRVEELAEILAVNFRAGAMPTYLADWRLQDPGKDVLSMCSSLLSIVQAGSSQVIEFSHFSVKEYLTSARLAKAGDIVSRYHVSMAHAHTTVAQACLGVLFHLNKSTSRYNLKNFPLVRYAASQVVGHARFQGVRPNVQDSMKRLFDPNLPHLALWAWVYAPPSLLYVNVSERMPSRLPATPLHYAATYGLYDVAEFLVIERSQDVNASIASNGATPLHVVSCVRVAKLLLEHGADVTAQDIYKRTSLHQAQSVEVAQVLLEHGADPTVQDYRKQTPLHDALSVEVARLLLEHGADATAQDVGKRTPLHRAQTVDHVRLLLDYGADVTAQDKAKMTPLHQASSVEVVRFLLERGADPTARNVTKRTPLHRVRDVEVARLLLKHGADATAQDENKRTPLHSARNVEIAQLLLEHGADVTAQDGHKGTPLHHARSLEIAQLLLKHGADVTAQNEFKETPLHLAYRVEIVRLLLEHGADAAAQNDYKRTPLYSVGDVEIARLLLEHGADATAQDDCNETPLHNVWNADITQLLLKHGADVTALDNRKRTPLHQARSMELAQLLLEHGADVTAQDDDNRTPLHYTHIVEVAQLLLECGADARAQDNHKQTPLHRAHGVEVAQLLVKYGADATAQDDYKRTPLHHAESVEVAQLLLEHGADVTAQDDFKQTPLHHAQSVEIAQLLLAHGADATAQDVYKRTPLHRTENVEVSRLVLEHGADATARDIAQRTPLHHAMSMAVVRLLLAHGADATAQDDRKRTPLHEVKDGNAVRFLLEHGADATARDHDGRTPLHNAGSGEAAQLLLENGADANAKDDCQRTPLHEVWNAEVVRLLLEHGADATAQDDGGRTPLHGVRNAAVVRLLLEHGADATAQDEYKRTPLHQAANDVAVARLLLKHGADAMAEDEHKRTPLHEVRSMRVARVLLNHGADATARDDGRRTPLHYALGVEVARLLLDCGADPTALDEDDETPLHWASRRGDVEVCRLLLGRRAYDADAQNDAYRSLLEEAEANQSRCKDLVRFKPE